MSQGGRGIGVAEHFQAGSGGLWGQPQLLGRDLGDRFEKGR